MGFWRFAEQPAGQVAEAEGSIRDASGFGNHGRLQGKAKYVTGSGSDGTAIAWTGSGFLEVPDAHVFDFQADDVAVGESGAGGKISQLNLESPGKVKVSFDVNALLAETPTPYTESIRRKRLDQKPYWHIERARLEGTRKVPVEVLVNGYAIAKQDIVADGELRDIADLDGHVPLLRGVGHGLITASTLT